MKPKKGKRRPNVFIDDRGFPDQSHDWDVLLSNMDGGTVLRKRKHPSRSLDDIDPTFAVEFDEARHGAKFKKDFKPSAWLSPAQNAAVANLVKKYWCVFDDTGLFIPVKDYECVIDTGSAAPIAVKKINYGPRETPIMRKCVAKLEELGHISQIHDGPWLFKALLAAKPHQEHVTNIEDFVWRFCVNYIPLNSVTRLIAYPIPRCDAAVTFDFNGCSYVWTMDATQGYHQLRVAPESREKLAFAGPDTIKWTYNVMPFGPVNGPSIFITFMHDKDSTWKEYASQSGIKIGTDADTRLIVDDILSFARTFAIFLSYLEWQLKVCRSSNLSLCLKKCVWCPKRVEFVGIDVGLDGNRPAMSKHQLLKSWPSPVIVRDVASFVGFAIFYAMFIPMFEVRVARLRMILKEEYTAEVAPFWDDKAKSEWEDIKEALLSDPCLQRFNHRKRVYVLTDFCKEGFGWCACQPGDDNASIAAMEREMLGGDCEFLKPGTKLTLHPIAFGCRRCRGPERRLHSHLGEGFAGDFGINKLRLYCWGMTFTWITDCYAIRFILSYDGNNPALLRLQMRLMCWDMVIVHRPGTMLSTPDYLSRLGADLCFDPLVRAYYERIHSLRAADPPPTTLPMQPINMPGYRGPRRSSSPAAPAALLQPDDVDGTAQSIFTSIFLDDANGHSALSHVPVVFGTFAPEVDLAAVYRSSPLYHSELVLTARTILEFQWAVYSFNSGHFMTNIRRHCLPFRVTLAADTTLSGRSCFKEFTNCQRILTGAKEMLDHVRSSGDTSPIDGYLIHSHDLSSASNVSAFWQIQASLVVQLRSIRNLPLFVAIISHHATSRAITVFCNTLSDSDWVISSTDLYFPDYGDSVAGSARLLIGVHRLSTDSVAPVHLPTPPRTRPPPLGSFVWSPFNTRLYAVSYAKSSAKFGQSSDDFGGQPTLIASEPKPSATTSRLSSLVKYCLHPRDADPSSQVGSDVMSLDHLCPPYSTSSTTGNIFQHSFGIEFRCDDDICVRPFSPFEFCRCFDLSDDLTYRLSHADHTGRLDGALPGRTSQFIFNVVHDRLVAIRDSNLEIFDPSNHAAPAAISNVFVNGAIGHRLPDASVWKKAYEDDPDCQLISRIIRNPALATKEHLSKVHHTLRMPLRQGLMIIEDDMIYLREPLGGGSDSYCKLRYVPQALRNTVFIAFHANPIGGHFNYYRTFKNIRLRMIWPGMFSFIKDLCGKCPACALSNRNRTRARELVYGFPIIAPFLVLFADGYTAGAQKNFDGESTYLIVACGMTGFAVMEPVRLANATGFSAALMRIMLRFGICHTLVVDKASVFFSIFEQVAELLRLNLHVLSGDNHDAMLVERVNKYLNKGLRVMTNERNSIRVSSEAILLLLYAWNSAPIPGTDLPRSLVAVGRVFSFPIDFSVAKHLELTSTPADVINYAKDQAELLSASEQVARILLDEHRSYHRELINSNRPDPRLYAIGDIVFAQRATRSDAARGRVGKLMNKMTGPWRVIEKLDGGSYRLEHQLRPGRFDKKHASMLSPYPLELVPFQPVDGPDTRFGQLNRPIGKDPFIDAGIKGFEPVQPFKLPAHLATVPPKNGFYWPSVAELNDEMFPFPWEPGEREALSVPANSVDEVEVFYDGPPPAAPSTVPPPSVPTISTLSSAIVQSSAKLFFVAHSLGSSSYREWRLVRVALADSLALHPSCLQDGRFLVDFYIPHSSDVRFNHLNQRFWLQYYATSDIATPADSSRTHLIRPSDSSEQYALSHGLKPLRLWVNLSQPDTYIHGPFEFATIRGRRSRDRIDRADWEILLSRRSLFDNAAPKLDLPSFSVHIDRGIHVAISNPAHCATLCAVIAHSQNHGDTLYC